MEFMKELFNEAEYKALEDALDEPTRAKVKEAWKATKLEPEKLKLIPKSRFDEANTNHQTALTAATAAKDAAEKTLTDLQKSGASATQIQKAFDDYKVEAEKQQTAYKATLDTNNRASYIREALKAAKVKPDRVDIVSKLIDGTKITSDKAGKYYGAEDQVKEYIKLMPECFERPADGAGGDKNPPAGGGDGIGTGIKTDAFLEGFGGISPKK